MGYRNAVLLLLLFSLAFMIAAGQTPTKVWTAPKTSDGHPDLQGFWSNAVSIPLERPKEFGAKGFLTDED